MAINQDLLAKLESRLGLSRGRIYQKIQDIELSKHVSGHVASLMLAAQNGIPYGRYATAEDRGEIRAASSGQAASHTSTASPTAARASPRHLKR
jgi:hypothetical protein